MRQTYWERWFLISVIIFFAFFFVGALKGSAQAFPNFLYGFIPATINLAVCVLYGLKKH